jgi:hypothetical protein
LRPRHKLGQLGDIEGDPARFVPRQQSRSGASAGFAFEINVSQCLTVVVADDEAASVVLFDIPGRREAAGLVITGI